MPKGLLYASSGYVSFFENWSRLAFSFYIMKLLAQLYVSEIQKIGS